MKQRKLSLVVLAAIAGGASLAMIGCSTAPKSAEDKSEMANSVDQALAKFQANDPGLRDELSRAAGYAVLPSVGKGGFIVGGAYGRGEVYEHGKMIGYCDLSQGSIGAQIGGEAFSELIVFRDQSALDKFKAGQFNFAGNATATAIKPGAAVGAIYRDGVAVFLQTKGGLMADASLAGQNISFVPL
jgi:lipid-binding SYLF domain-containing protein